ncbi:MAG: hypothetical protein H6819_06150 [Phycisphaerales bacterium]|nr:hypothetical protein [Phycisphaerales bacterium]MCB9858598.1 hypothetical protein [Phycisphaerales bacterium]
MSVSTTVSTGGPNFEQSNDKKADHADGSPSMADGSESTGRDLLVALADTLLALTPDQRERLSEMLRTEIA